MVTTVDSRLAHLSLLCHIFDEVIAYRLSKDMPKSRRDFIHLMGTGLFAAGLTRCSSTDPEIPVIQKTNLFIGTSTEGDSSGIYHAELDTVNPGLANFKLAAETENPGFIVLHPRTENLFAVGQDENGNGLIKSFEINSDKTLAFVDEQLTGSGGLAHVDISPNGRSIAAANYGGGNVSLLGLNTSQSFSGLSDLAQHEGTGPNTSRQEAPHAHCTIFSRDSNFLYVADLGIDKVMIYEVDHDNVKLNPASTPFVSTPPGSGPRHFKIHPSNDVAFVINELDSTLTSFSRDISTGALDVIETVSTLDPDFQGESYCADLHISSDGRFVYGSNRGDNSIAVFKFENMQLELIQTISTGGNWPRNFALDPSEKFLIVGNRRSSDISLFGRDSDTGLLERIGGMVSQASPICLIFQA